MKTRANNTTNNLKRTRAYRARIHNQGVKRVEVRIPERDVPLVHGVAGILRTGGDNAAVLREQLQQATGRSGQTTGGDLVMFFRNSPLMDNELSLERDKATSRTISFE